MPPFLAKLLFAPGQHPHAIGLVLVPTIAEMKAVLDGSKFDHIHIPEAGEGDPRGACCFEFEGTTEFGFVIFAEESLTPGILVHELTHAGMLFVTHKVMTSRAVQAKTPEEQEDYYEEACAQTVEALFDQAFPLLFTVPHRTKTP